MLSARLSADRPHPATSRHVLLTMMLAVGARGLSAVYQGDAVAPLPGIFDQMTYHALAQRVLDGHGFTFAEGYWPATPAEEPTAHWSFLYTLYLVAVYAVVGVQPLVARVIQAVVAGWLHTWLVYRVGARVFGPAVGAVSALFTAVYIYFVYYAGGLVTETFYFVGILWTLDASLRIAARPTSGNGSRRWAELGLAIGFTVLLRQVFLVFVPLLFAWLWWTLRPASAERRTAGSWRRPTLAGLGVASVVVALAIAPWTLRNYQVFGAFVPLNTNAGFALYWGNHPIHGTRFMPLLEGAEQGYGELIPRDVRHLNEGAMDRALLGRAVAIIRDDPWRYLLLSLSRTREYFKFWPSSESSALSNVARVASFGVCLPLMIYGLALAVPYVRRPETETWASAIGLLYLWVGAYTGIHLLTWTLVRYRLPIDIVLLVFAAFGAVSLARRWSTTTAAPPLTMGPPADRLRVET